MIHAFLLELRRGRALVLWVAVVAMFYAGFMTAFYPNVLENAEQFETMLAIYPKELMAAFGITGSLGNQGTFVNSYIFQFLWPLVAAIVAILSGTRLAVDADTGFLDLPLSSRLSRARYLTSVVGAQIVGLVALTALTMGSIVLVDLFIEPDFDAGRLALAGVHAGLFAAMIAGPTTALAVVFLERGRAGGLVAAILIVMYLLNVVAAISPDLEGLARVSVFHYFDLKDVVNRGAYPTGDSLIFLVVAAVGWLAAIVLFRRRNLSA